MYYVYTIKSLRDGKNYTGMTINLQRRLSEHNRGQSGTPSTKSRGPFELIHYEKCFTREEARTREKYFKSGSGREFLKLNKMRS